MKIAIISDIHANLEALKSTLEDIKKRKVDKIICLGDIIAKGVHPKECIELIKEEIGLDVQKDDLKLFYSDRDDKDQVFFDLYYMKKDLDINTLVLQEEEVESIEWDSLEDIQALRDAGKFKRAHAEAFDRLLKLMNNN